TASQNGPDRVSSLTVVAIAPSARKAKSAGGSAVPDPVGRTPPVDDRFAVQPHALLGGQDRPLTHEVARERSAAHQAPHWCEAGVDQVHAPDARAWTSPRCDPRVT